MDAPDLSQPFVWANAYELASWLGTSIDTALELVWTGALPPPRFADPLVWHMDDLEAWAEAGCPLRDVPHRDWHFRPSIVVEGNFRIEDSHE